MAINAKQILKQGMFFLVAIVLIWLAIRNMSAEERTQAFESIKNIKLVYLVPIVIFNILSHVLRALRWNALLEPLGHNIQFKNAFFSVMAGYLVNYGIPRAGEITRCTLISNYEKVPFQTALGTVVLERLIDFILLIIFTITAVFLQFKQAKTLLDQHILVPVGNKLNLLVQNPLLLSTIVVLVMLFFIVLFLLRKKISSFFKTKFGSIIKGFLDGLSSIRKVENKFAFIWQSVAIWMCYYLGMYCGLFLFEDIRITPSEMLVTYILGTVGIIFTPGGLGAYQIIVAEALKFYHVGEAAAIAFAWANWLVGFFIILVTGGISFLLLPLMNKNKSTHV